MLGVEGSSSGSSPHAKEDRWSDFMIWMIAWGLKCTRGISMVCNELKRHMRLEMREENASDSSLLSS